MRARDALVTIEYSDTNAVARALAQLDLSFEENRNRERRRSLPSHNFAFQPSLTNTSGNNRVSHITRSAHPPMITIMCKASHHQHLHIAQGVWMWRLRAGARGQKCQCRRQYSRCLRHLNTTEMGRMKEFLKNVMKIMSL